LTRFIVKGRVKYLNVESNRNSNGFHLNAIVFDDSSEIEIVAFKNCENIAKLLKVNIFIIIYFLIYVKMYQFIVNLIKKFTFKKYILLTLNLL